MAAEGASVDSTPAPACGTLRVTAAGEWNERPLSAYPGTWRTWCKECLAICDGNPAAVTDTVLRASPCGEAKLHVPQGAVDGC